MPLRAIKGKTYNGVLELYRTTDKQVTGYYLSYRDADGKPQKHRVEAKNRDEALLKLNQIKADNKRAKLRERVGTKGIRTIGELAVDFFTTKNKKSEKNINATNEENQYNSHLKDMVIDGKYTVSTLPTDGLLNKHIITIQSNLADKGLGNKTINNITDVLRAIISHGEKNKIIKHEDNPLHKYDRLKVDNRVDRTLTGAEIKKLIESIEKPRMKLFVAMGYYTAQRPESLRRLQKKDINDGKIFISAIKEQKSHFVPIHPELATILNDWIIELDEDDYLFHTVTSKGKAVAYPQLQVEAEKIFEPYNKPLYYVDGMTEEEENTAKKTAYKKDRKKWVSLYTLRHSSATNMLEATGDIAMVSSILNHSTVILTQRYAKPTDESKAKGINAL